MNKKFKEINKRNNTKIVCPSGEDYAISEEREKKGTVGLIIHAFFNYTTWLYTFLYVINTLGLILLLFGIIG